MTVFDEFKKHYQQRDLAAKQWKEGGGKVVGYFCDNVPEEFIMAAGFFPLRFSGDPNGDTAKVGNYSEEGNVFSREGFVASMLHMILNGAYDYVDYLIIPHARDSVMRLYTTLQRYKETGRSKNIPELFFLDSLHTPFYSAGIYNSQRWLEMNAKLEEWAGNPIADDKLGQAIEITNENKSLLKQLAELRTSNPPKVSGVEALQIIGACMFMPKEAHNRLLKQWLADADQLPEKKGARVFVEGSPLDHLQFYDIIESCGAIVVAEDNCWGNRYSDVSIDTNLDPTEAVINRYNNKSPCTRMYPLSRRVDYCLQSALDAKAQGVIFNIFRFDEMQAWEVPDEIEALKAKGIPSLYLKNQPYRIDDSETVKEKVLGFIQSI